jgi:hypothetical protein
MGRIERQQFPFGGCAGICIVVHPAPQHRFILNISGSQYWSPGYESPYNQVSP